MYCRHCGKQNLKDAQFCSFCGKRIKDNSDEGPTLDKKGTLNDKCKICGKKLHKNDLRFPTETGDVICKDCNIAFLEDVLPKNVLEVIKNKEKCTSDELKNAILWLRENEYFDEARDIEMYVEKQQKNPVYAEDCLDQTENQLDTSETNYDSKNAGVSYQLKHVLLNIVDLKEYLEIVINMENNIYMQENMISKMKERYNRLGQSNIYDEPTEPYDSSGEDVRLAITLGCTSLIAVFLFSWGLQFFKGGASDFLDYLLAIIIVFFSGLLFIGMIISAFSILAEAIKKANQYAQDKATYNKLREKYEIDYQTDIERVKKENLEKEILASEISLLQKQNGESKKNLSKIYSLNIIFPKYRNLAMLCSIYEYICTGRCTSLAGHAGAYNILEMEIRLDKIITKLDQIAFKLNDIRNNQYILYSAIQETNQQISQIMKSTDYVMDRLQNFKGEKEELVAKISSIEKNSMLAAYQAERVQKELQYMNRMDYLTGKDDSVFYNVPPS